MGNYSQKSITFSEIIKKIISFLVLIKLMTDIKRSQELHNRTAVS